MPTSIAFALLIASAGAEGPTPSASVEEVLALWGQRSSEIRTIQARVTVVDRPGTRLPISSTYRYAWRADGDAVLEISEVVDGGEPSPRERLVLAGGDFFRLQARHRSVVVLKANDREAYRRAMEAGPSRIGCAGFAELVCGVEDRFRERLRPEACPLFLRIDPGGLKSRYRVELAREKAGQLLLKLVPTAEAEAREASRVEVLLNKGTMLPDAVKVWSPSGKETRTLTYARVEVNSELPGSLFLPGSLEGWTVTERRMPAAGSAPPSR